ncbi:MAG: hypothetical protein JST16_02310 [Bdellovibrionales bacterium]|nr:hypothetical protein [Bdellovibrionales bacterium]
MAMDGISGPGGAAGETVGAQLNRMSGVESQKNLYGDKNKLGKDAFLKMFTEQLKNQDPLNPMANEQFSQQMAMFSQLEQQITMNKNLEKMISQQSNMQIAALQLVGKNIQADKAGIYHDKDKPSAINFKIPADAQDLKIQITDMNSGDVLRTIELGSRNAGEVSTKWDGMSNEGRPEESGRYSYKIVAKGMDGKEMNIPTKIDGKVNGVTTEKGVTFLLVGDQKVGLGDVEVIKEGTPDANVAKAEAKPLFGSTEIPAGTKSEDSKAAEVEKKPTSLPTISVEAPDAAPSQAAEDSGGRMSDMPMFLR